MISHYRPCVVSLKTKGTPTRELSRTTLYRKVHFVAYTFWVGVSSVIVDTFEIGVLIFVLAQIL